MLRSTTRAFNQWRTSGIDVRWNCVDFKQVLACWVPCKKKEAVGTTLWLLSMLVARVLTWYRSWMRSDLLFKNRLSFSLEFRQRLKSKCRAFYMQRVVRAVPLLQMSREIRWNVKAFHLSYFSLWGFVGGGKNQLKWALKSRSCPTPKRIWKKKLASQCRLNSGRKVHQLWHPLWSLGREPLVSLMLEGLISTSLFWHKVASECYTECR